MSSRIALLDMDGTVADYASQMLHDLKALASPDEPELTRENMWNMGDWLEHRMWVIKKQPGWWLNLPRYKPGFEILEVLLSVGFKVMVLTKGPSHTTAAWTEKVEWCHKNLPKSVKTVITEDAKDIVFGRVFVDDYVPFMEPWLKRRPRGLGIMPLDSGNGDFNHARVVHYDGTNIERVRSQVQRAYDRKDGEMI
jgi:5'-nucleotidase